MFKDINTILKLLTAIFLERSIIFISKDSVRLSSAVLGLKAMMNPLNWCHSLIPILPGALLDYIESPCPIICGITNESYYLLLEDFNLEEDFIQSFTWVYLDHIDSNESSQEMNAHPIFEKSPELHLTGIKWCSGTDAISFEEYLWFREYPGLSDLIDLHQDFIDSIENSNTSPTLHK